MSELKKSLGAVSGTALMLNTVLGAGVLTLPGLAAGQVGSQALWTWIACATATVPLLIVFTVLSSRYPEAGGVGHIAKIAFGPVGQVVVSALFLGAVLLGLPSIALTAGHYVGTATGLAPAAVAVLLIACAGGLNLALPGTASRIGVWIAAAVAAFLIVLVGAAAVVTATGPISGSPSFPVPDATLFLPFMLVFFAFTGWEVAIGASEEFEDPRRDMPRAVAASFAITVVFYVVCSIVVTRAGDAGSGAAPFLTILAPAPTSTTGRLIASGTALLLTANLFAAIWAVSRMLFSLSREQLLPRVLMRARSGVPRAAVVTTTAAIAAVAGLDGADVLEVETLFSVAGQNFLIIYAVSAVALVMLARTLVERIIGVGAVGVSAILVALAGLHFGYPLTLVTIGLAGLWLRERRNRFGKEDAATA